VFDQNGGQIGAVRQVGQSKARKVLRALTSVDQFLTTQIRFDLLDAAGTTHGTIAAENWRAWNFSITDAQGTEVARITKTWEGAIKTMFTTADNYMVQIHSPLSEPLRSLVVAAALAVDTALKQDSRGLS
jgi:uncharacterized protein YxjI